MKTTTSHLTDFAAHFPSNFGVTFIVSLIATVFLISNSSLALDDKQVTVEGKSSSKFILAAKYGYRNQNPLCLDLNPWNSSHRSYKDITDLAEETANGSYKLTLMPPERMAPGFCNWKLVTLSIRVMTKVTEPDIRVLPVQIVIRNIGELTKSTQPVPTPFENYGQLVCKVKAFENARGYDNFTHFVECLAGNGETITFNQSVMNIDDIKTFTLNFEE